MKFKLDLDKSENAFGGLSYKVRSHMCNLKQIVLLLRSCMLIIGAIPDIVAIGKPMARCWSSHNTPLLE